MGKIKVLVGSLNPVKINATKEAFSRYFDDLDIIPMKVDSGVSHQPLNVETYDGARNRAKELKKINDEQNLGADFFVGQEGGAFEIKSKWFAVGAMCIIDKHGNEGFGSTGYFQLPDSVSQQLIDGTELGDVMDSITGVHNSKQKGGAISFFSKGELDRTSFYVQGLVVALIPFLHEKLYFNV